MEKKSSLRAYVNYRRTSARFLDAVEETAGPPPPLYSQQLKYGRFFS
jgi:hypothetical protein